MAASLDAHFNTLVFDYARCKTDKDLKKCLTGVQKKGGALEQLQFSDEVIKINRKKDRQLRCLLITDQAIYNFKPKKYKEFQRRIGLEELQCVVLSKNSDEMVFQVSSAYDYRFVVPRKVDALTMLHKYYEAINKKKLELVYSDEKELDDFVVTKSMLANTKTKEANAKAAAAASTATAASPSNSATAASPNATASPMSAAGAKSPTSFNSGVSAGTQSNASAKSATNGGAAPAASQSGQFPAVKRDGGTPRGGTGMRASTLVSVGTPAPGGLLGLKGAAASGSNSGRGSGGSNAAPGQQFWAVEGWLTKKAGTSITTKWDRRYCVLDPERINYYFPKIKGQLPLPGCRVLNTGAVSLAVNTSTGSDAASLVKDALAKRAEANREAQMFPFTVCYDKDKKFEVAAETEADLARWIAVFESYGPGKEKKDQIEHEGWLLKRDPTTKQMRRRYVIIIGEKCWYFEMVQKGEIEIGGGASAFETKEVEPTESKSSELWLQSSSRFSHRFNIGASYGSRVYHMAADTNEDMKQWIQALEHNNKVRATSDKTKQNGSPAGGAVAGDLKDVPSAAGAVGSGAGGRRAIPSSMIDSIQEEAPTGQVTFVFTDVQSSTTLWEKVPDAMDISLALHDQILRALLKKYRGYEVKTEGDAFMVTFFNVMDAILWCLAVQEALCKASWPEPLLALSSASLVTLKDPSTQSNVTVFNGIRIRMGIHTGQPNCRKNPLHGRMDYFGPVVNRSARVSDTAHGGQVVMTQECYDVLHSETGKKDERIKDDFPLTADMGCHHLKGVPEDVRIWQILPRSLKLRTYPPLRTLNNEKKARAEKRARGEPVDTESDEEDPDIKTAAAAAAATAKPAVSTTATTTTAAAASAKPNLLRPVTSDVPPPPAPADDDDAPPPAPADD